MKRNFFSVCYYINILMLLVFCIVFISPIFFRSAHLIKFFNSEMIVNIRMLLTVPVIILWIKNLQIWSKKDKNINRFFLLFLLSGFYSPFYFKRILKNNWL